MNKMNRIFGVVALSAAALAGCGETNNNEYNAQTELGCTVKTPGDRQTGREARVVSYASNQNKGSARQIKVEIFTHVDPKFGVARHPSSHADQRINYTDLNEAKAAVNAYCATGAMPGQPKP